MKFLQVAILALVFVISETISAVNPETEEENIPRYVISKINILGNKTTKNWIIIRELSFSEGDSLTKFELINRFETSKQNLNNTSLFNTIEFNFIQVDDLYFEVYINVSERWYFWPRPIFELAETNFNSWWENKDFSRINYGLEFIQNNFRGRNEKLKFIVQLGFTEKLMMSYSIPYINKKRSLGLSLNVGYGQNHEVNYLSGNNKRLFYKDVERVQQRNFTSGFLFRYRKKFYSSHLFGGQYNEVGVSDSVLFYNSNYLIDSENNMKFLSLSYQYILDQRDNKNYPLTGHYFSVSTVKYGLNILSPSLDLWWNQLEFKKFTKLTKRFYLAGMIQAHFYANEDQPYFFRDGLGYTDKSTVRAYELYVIDAQQMGTGKLQLRYQIVAPKEYDLAMMPVNKFKKFHYSFYLGLFADVGAANDQWGYPENNLANQVQSGYGISLDLVTYYDLVFRAEYSINKFGEHGLFLHFVSPI